MAKNSFDNSTYTDILRDSTVTKSTYNTIVVVLLFSIISSLFGYFVGTTNLLQRARGILDITLNPTSDQNATQYTNDELNRKLNGNAYDLALYYQIAANLKDKYVDPSQVTDEKLFDGSLKGLVSSIGDSPTVYMNRDDYKKYREGFSGTFQGIGVRLEYDKNRVIVSDVIENSPAKLGGVQQGFIFLEVDGKNVETSLIEDVVNLVRGESGSKVKIKFFDPLKNTNIEKEITRAPITVESMRLIEKDKDTVVFELSRFTEDSLDTWTMKWNASVKTILEKGYKNIILDMRGNLGGYLNAAVYAANDFLGPDTLILTERTRANGDKQIRTTNKSPKLKDKKIIILVNGGTASAAEILAGSLRQNNDKYMVLGARTYGKGTVQETYNLPNGGALKVTTEYWLMPNGKKLDNQNPITPDKELVQDQEKFRQGYDNILEEALKQIKS